MKLQIIALFTFVILFTLVGCSNTLPTLAHTDTLVRTKDIQPYIEQWDNNKEHIARLSTMEQDLTLLIQALALQTNIDTAPATLKTQLKSEEHGSKNPPPLIKKPNKTTHYGINIGRYIIEQGAQTQAERLKRQYPTLNNIVQYQVQAQNTQATTMYNLVAGPLKNQRQAAQLCLFFKKQGNNCTLATFKYNL